MLETLIREAIVKRIKLPEIPSDFLTLVDNEIIKAKYVNKGKLRTNNLDEHLCISLGQWLGMEEPLTRRDVRRHLRHKWKKIRHAMNLRNDIDSQGSSNVITERISRKKKTQLIISARDRYIVKSECVTDINGRTLIHLENLNNPNAIEKATDAINHYYFHTLNNPSHRSDEFWSNFIEHFGHILYTISSPTPARIPPACIILIT